MNPLKRWTTWLVLCGGSSSGLVLASSVGTGSDGPRFDDSVQVAGHALRLNGAGLSQRMIFKVYAISLYLLEPRSTAEAVLDAPGPRRIAITMLRDVGGAEFASAMAESIAAQLRESGAAQVDKGLLSLGMTIAAQPRGLHKGDRLTLDWVPETGIVVELNQKSLAPPIADRPLYNELLSVWLGAKASDGSLRSRLLGRAE